MLDAVLIGCVASSALLIGAGIGVRWDIPRLVTANALAFASGALISALAFELVADAYEQGGAWRTAAGLFSGAAVFVLVDTWLDRRTMGETAPSQPALAGSAVGLALLAAVTLDGVPENLALGVSLSEASPIPLLAAIFASNLPEALVGAVAMRRAGTGDRDIMLLWLACAVALAAMVVIGRAAGDAMSPRALAVALGFAGGAVLASLADTTMPEAYERGGPGVAMATSGGFMVGFLLAEG